MHKTYKTGLISGHGGIISNKLCVIPDNLWIVPRSITGKSTKTTDTENVTWDKDYKSSNDRGIDMDFDDKGYISWYGPGSLMSDVDINFKLTWPYSQNSNDSHDSRLSYAGIITGNITTFPRDAEEARLKKKLGDEYTTKNISITDATHSNQLVYSNYDINSDSEIKRVLLHDNNNIFNIDEINLDKNYNLGSLLNKISNYIKEKPDTIIPRVYILDACRGFSPIDLKPDIACPILGQLKINTGTDAASSLTTSPPTASSPTVPRPRLVKTQSASRIHELQNFNERFEFIKGKIDIINSFPDIINNTFFIPHIHDVIIEKIQSNIQTQNSISHLEFCYINELNNINWEDDSPDLKNINKEIIIKLRKEYQLLNNKSYKGKVIKLRNLSGDNVIYNNFLGIIKDYSLEEKRYIITIKDYLNNIIDLVNIEYSQLFNITQLYYIPSKLKLKFKKYNLNIYNKFEDYTRSITEFKFFIISKGIKCIIPGERCIHFNYDECYILSGFINKKKSNIIRNKYIKLKDDLKFDFQNFINKVKYNINNCFQLDSITV